MYNIKKKKKRTVQGQTSNGHLNAPEKREKTTGIPPKRLEAELEV
jgi:hypothetical protein